MPVRKDETGKRWVEMELFVPGSPEDVWKAIATGPGTSAWFVKTEIEERVGGAIRFDFGVHGSSAGEVTTWDPPHRFGYVERDWNPGAPPVATEIVITSRSGDRCVMRMVHSLFATTDDWDDQLEGFEAGWPGFFDVLRIYMERFRGQRAAVIQAKSTSAGASLPAWRRLLEALNLTGADVGERRALPREPEPLEAVVERIVQDAAQRYVVIRVDSPPAIAVIGVHEGAFGSAGVGLYLYGEDAAQRAANAEPRWQSWVRSLFAAR
jgi:uncharacterized protein YndB with AHSA1/START domain